MKKQILTSLLLVLILATSALAQRKVKDGTVTGSSDLPAGQALLELESNNKGFLPPRLTTVQRDAIPSPASGLIIYNTTTKCVEFYDGTAWNSKCAPTSGGTAVISNIDCKSGTGFSGKGLSEKIQTSGATQTISVTVSSPGTYLFYTNVSNGIIFAGAGNFPVVGTKDVVLTANGIPLVAGAFTYSVDGKCSFTVTTDPSVLAICDGTQPTTVVEVTTATGKVWMDRNLGAIQAATSIDDPGAKGCLYQWGRGNDGHANALNSKTQSQYTATETNVQATTTSPGHSLLITGFNDWLTPSNNNLWQGVSGINNPCPSGFRVPTREEWDAEFTDIPTLPAAYNSVLKIRTGPGPNYWAVQSKSGSDTGNWAMFWSASPWTPTNLYPTVSFVGTFFWSQAHTNQGSGRAQSIAVRCIKN